VWCSLLLIRSRLAAEKKLRYGVGVAVMIHAGDQVVGLQKGTPISVAVLAVLIRVHHYCLLRLSSPHSRRLRASNNWHFDVRTGKNHLATSEICLKSRNIDLSRFEGTSSILPTTQQCESGISQNLI